MATARATVSRLSIKSRAINKMGGMKPSRGGPSRKSPNISIWNDRHRCPAYHRTRISTMLSAMNRPQRFWNIRRGMNRP